MSVGLGVGWRWNLRTLLDYVRSLYFMLVCSADDVPEEATAHMLRQVPRWRLMLLALHANLTM
jgi:hypothetical protein